MGEVAWTPVIIVSAVAAVILVASCIAISVIKKNANSGMLDK